MGSLSESQTRKHADSVAREGNSCGEWRNQGWSIPQSLSLSKLGPLICPVRNRQHVFKHVYSQPEASSNVTAHNISSRLKLSEKKVAHAQAKADVAEVQEEHVRFARFASCFW